MHTHRYTICLNACDTYNTDFDITTDNDMCRTVKCITTPALHGCGRGCAMKECTDNYPQM